VAEEGGGGGLSSAFEFERGFDLFEGGQEALRGPHYAHVVKIDDDHGVLLPLPLIAAQEMSASLGLQADGRATRRFVQQLKRR
jgi:hypothetical protein